jgi:hypothetical protein
MDRVTNTNEFDIGNTHGLRVSDAIDYRCQTGKKIGELRGDISAIWIFDRSWVPLSENPDVHPQKTNLSQEMHSRILRLSVGLKMSRVVEKLLFNYLPKIPPIDSWHQVDSNRCNFHILMPTITLVSLLEIWFGLKMPRRVATSENDRQHIDRLCRIRIWGDTYGGVRVLTFKALWCPGGRANRGSLLNFGAAYLVANVFDCKFLKIIFF